MITSVFEMIEQWFLTPSCLPRQYASKHVIALTLKDRGQNLTSGQGHVVTQVGHIAYVSMCLDLEKPQWDHSHVSISFGSNVIRKKLLVTLRLPQMIFGGSPMKTIAWVITEDLRQHHSQWMEMFRCEKEVIEILPIDFTLARSRNWPDLRSRI